MVTLMPKKTIRTTSDVNMFLTRHKLLHEDERVPRLPLSISHCWINTVLEQEKLRFGDTGYFDSKEASPGNTKFNNRISPHRKKTIIQSCQTSSRTNSKQNPISTENRLKSIQQI